MLKRFSSLILALVIGSSVLAGTVQRSNDHICKMAGMEMMPGTQMPTASPSLSPSHEMMPDMQMPTASPSLSPSHEMMPGMQMPTASPSLSPSHEMMPDMQMPTASPSLSQSHEMMPGMQMPTASPSLSQSHEMMPGMQMPTASPPLSQSHEMMPGIQVMPGMETMPCCKKHETQSVSSESGSPGQCCVNIPQETGSSGTTFNLRSPSYSIVVIHAAVVQSPLAAPKPYERSYSTEVFLPNLQASYIRNHSFLI